MNRLHTNLRVASLDRDAHERTCGYWYTVTSGAMAHTAFATRAGLDRWMSERNLTLQAALPAKGELGSAQIIGTYRTWMHLYDVNDFYAIQPIDATPLMSNGDYTLGLITEDDDGVRTIHSLNPNVRTRMVFDYLGTRKVMS